MTSYNVNMFHHHLQVKWIFDMLVTIPQVVIKKGGQFLEAPVSGSKKPAEDGQLIILAAGDKVTQCWLICFHFLQSCPLYCLHVFQS